MDDEPQIEAELHSPQTMDDRRDQFTGAFFPGAQHFVVAGGNFKSVTNITQAVPDLPSDFRRFPIGDLDLRSEIQLDYDSGLVHRCPKWHSVRRVYSAHIEGFKSKMTVALYEGDNAEEEWREDIARYSGLRHPNIVQLFGMASACGMHAAIFKDELIPAQQLFEKYSGSHLRTVHLFNFRDIEFKGASNYIASILGSLLDATHCTMWIRPSTGRLCVDPTDRAYGSALTYDHDLTWDASFSSNLSVLEAPEDSKIVDSISLDRYHAICSFHLENHRQLSISMNASVRLGAVILCPPGSEIEHPNEIAYIPDPYINDSGWRYTRASLTVLESGWTRMDSSEVWDGNIEGQIYASGSLLEEAWLAQANHIFHRLGITSNHNDYVLVWSITYTLRLATSDSIPPGYLFLCALEDLQADSPSRFRLSECPAYWSLDPTGDERLSVEEAERLGFPNPEFKMEVRGWSWDERVYNGSRQFYQAKGFDPESQDIARELGLPLFEISTEVDGPFAHIEETDVCDHRSGIQNIPDSEVLQPVAHGESGLHFPPDQRVASSSTPAPQMFSFGAHVQGSAIDESFDPCFFESSTPSARSSHNFSFNFEFPFHDQPYYLPPLESSSRSQFTPFAVAGSSINLLGPSGMQFTTPPPSLWTSFPHLPPIPAPPPPPCLPTDPVAAHLESGSGKRKSRDDDPAEDINIHAWRPRKMATRADLWGV